MSVLWLSLSSVAESVHNMEYLLGFSMLLFFNQNCLDHNLCDSSLHYYSVLFSTSASIAGLFSVFIPGCEQMQDMNEMVIHCMQYSIHLSSVLLSAIVMLFVWVDALRSPLTSSLYFNIAPSSLSFPFNCVFVKIFVFVELSLHLFVSKIMSNCVICLSPLNWFYVLCSHCKRIY